ncbi:MAG: hypothetical protein EBU52_11295 [Cytophagia bacterium]|nr:hypothetical protein [Cytophagia bacterium]
MKKIFAFALFAFIVSCQEEIQERGTPNPTNPGTDNGNPLPPTEPVAGKYANCLSVHNNATLDVATWNIENFPNNGTTTLNLAKEIINTMDADIIAVQEIVSGTNFNTLIASLDGYAGVVVGSGGSQKLGYIYKTSEITSFETPVELFTDDNCAFPRPALKTTLTHVSGKQVTFINVHLKCCDDAPTQSCLGGIERRRQASTKLKAYIDQNLSNQAVIVLGDWNDDITQPEGNQVFSNFVNDANNYKFADMPIATGSTANFSYQSTQYLSHLDHILISNELFNNLGVVRTAVLSTCEPQYKNSVSDHYPVIMRLQ